MANQSLVCGNCGKPVAASDVTCPYCDVLLAAYSSPDGSITAHGYESSAPIADAVPMVEITMPEPAAPVDLPTEIDVASTAPRPLFDTNITIEDIAEAAESDHSEPLVVSDPTAVTTKPTVFDVPDYARPPVDAEPIPIIDEIEREMIAQPTNGNAPAVKPEQVRTAGSPVPEPTGESWLYDTSRSGPTPLPSRPKRESKTRPVETTTRPTSKRSRTDSYPRKLHADPEYEVESDPISQPVQQRIKPSERGQNTREQNKTGRGMQARTAGGAMRKPASSLLYVVVVILWISVIISILTDNFSAGFIFFTIAVTYGVRYVNKRSRNADRS